MVDAELVIVASVVLHLYSTGLWNGIRSAYGLFAWRCVPQEVFAEKLGAVSKTVGYWERGEHPPGFRLQRELDNLFAKATDEQKQRFFAEVGNSEPTNVAPASTTLAHAQASEQEVPTNRRHALKLGAATAGIAVAASIESLDLSRDATAANIASGLLDQLERQVNYFFGDYNKTPHAELLVQAQLWRRYVIELTKGHHTLDESQRLRLIVGWLSVLLARLMHELGDNASAEVHCYAALGLAKEVGDPTLGAWARSLQANIATYMGRPREVLDAAQAGLRIAPAGSSVAALLTTHKVRAWARLGDRQAFEMAMIDAERAFEQLSKPPSDDYLDYPLGRFGLVSRVGTPDLLHRAATAYVRLGQPAQARNYAAQAIELCDANSGNWPVSCVTARIDQGLALVQGGELDGASLIGIEALDLTRRRPVDPIRQRSAELMRALQPHRDLSTVREFEERYRALWD